MIGSKFYSFRAYVKFSVTGDFVERFFNLLIENAEPVKDVVKSENKLEGYILANRYLLLRGYARTAQVRLRIIEKCGVPFYLRRYKKRFGLLIGLALVGISFFLLSLLIWDIQVVGCEELDPVDILAKASDLGINIGAYGDNLDYGKIENLIMLSTPELAWIGISAVGSKVVITVQEKVEIPEFQDTGEPSNIVSDYNGIIASIEAKEGLPLVSAGDGVLVGEILITGLMTGKTDQLVYTVHSVGTVTAYVEESHSMTFLFLQNEKQYTTDIYNRYSLRIFGVDLPLFLGFTDENVELVEEEVKYLTIFGISLPVGYTVQSVRDYKNVEMEYTAEQAEIYCREQFEKFEKTEFSDCKIESYTEKTTWTENSVIITRNYTILQEIGINVTF